jgi:hypothetical protein
MLEMLKRIWREAYGHKNQPVTTQSHPSHEELATPQRGTAPAASVVKKEVIPKPLSEAEYNATLKNISNLSDLDRYYQNCPKQFEHLFRQPFLDMLRKVDDIEELEDVYSKMHFGEFDEQILEQYQKVLPAFLVDCSLEDLEATYENCPDQERFGELIKKHYKELLEKLDSFEELEERRKNCPEDFNDFFRLPYQKLLLTVDSVEELDEYFGNCPEEFEDFYLGPYNRLLKKIDSLDNLEELKSNCHDAFDSLYAWHYNRLLETEDSLPDLEERYNNCDACFNGLILVRYQKVLQTVTSIEELAERFEDCDESFNGLLLVRCLEIMPLAIKDMPSEDFDEFCENLRDEFKPIALACRKYGP